jgi:prolyl oligopeptidase
VKPSNALALVAVLAACAPPPAPKPIAPAPVASAPPPRVPAVAAARRPVTHTYHGTSVVDDYEWLEDGQSAETRVFVDAQNALSRAKLDALPERPAVHARVEALYRASSADWYSGKVEAGRLFALKHAPPKQQPMLVDLGPVSGTKLPAPAKERVLVDPNALDPSGATTIDMFVPSPDGRLVAVSLSKGGSESGDLHVFDVAAGTERGETIARVYGGTAGGSVAWNADGTGFFYTRYPREGERPAAELGFWQQLWFHELGKPESADTMALGKDLPRIAEILLLRSRDGRRILAVVSNGDGGEYEHHVLDGGKWHRLSRFEDALSAASFAEDGKIYAVSRKGAPRGKIVALAPPFDHRSISDVIPEGDAVIDGVVATKDALYAVETADGPSRMRRFPLGAKAEPLAREAAKPAKRGKGTTPKSKPETIPAGARGPVAAELLLPPVASVSEVVAVGDDLLVRVESFVTPPRWMVYRASEHRLVPTSLERRAAYDMSDVDVVRESCASEDGTRVPMTVLRRRLEGKPLTPRPAYLTGYGGFGLTPKPRMRAAYRVWLDAGGVVAEANLRGGAERGEAWHRAGNLTNKQNVFDDFAACARTLVDLGYTRPQELAISGRSNGGLLMGASIVQHPDLFRAVAAGVGIYDMLRTELSPNGAFNVTEYGTVKDEAQFRALYAYSPFHNVKDGTRYPAMLLLTGANDPRVDPYHSRKMTARLQAATSSDAPILLRASEGTGHGMGTPLAAEIEEVSDALAFLMHEVGASLPAR